MKHRILVISTFLILLFALYLYSFTISCKISPKLSTAFDNSNTIFAQKFSKIYPIDMIIAIKGGIDISQNIKSASFELRNFTFHAKQDNRHSEKEIYVLIIGETARYSNFSINGYSRITNPLLAKTKNIISFSNVYSGANSTQLSLPILLTRATAQNFSIQSKEKSILEAFKEAGFSTYWIANQSSNYPFVQRIVQQTKGHFFAPKDFDSIENLDENLLPYLDKVIGNKEKKQFIVIHTLGSHFRYNFRYPKSFRKFTPDFEGAFDYSLISRNNKNRLVNSYDNSILYTDYFLAKTIQHLNNDSSACCMLYISDHGENLFENEYVLHGGSTPTKFDIHVPLIVWTSDKYKHLYSEKVINLNLNKNKKISSDFVFHSLLDFADIRMKGETLSKSIASKHMQEDSIRYMLNPDMELISFK